MFFSQQCQFCRDFLLNLDMMHPWKETSAQRTKLGKPCDSVLIQDQLNCFGQMLKGLSKTDDCIEKKLRDFQEIQASLFPF